MLYCLVKSMSINQFLLRQQAEASVLTVSKSFFPTLLHYLCSTWSFCTQLQPGIQAKDNRGPSSTYLLQWLIRLWEDFPGEDFSIFPLGYQRVLHFYVLYNLLQLWSQCIKRTKRTTAALKRFWASCRTSARQFSVNLFKTAFAFAFIQPHVLPCTFTLFWCTHQLRACKPIYQPTVVKHAEAAGYFYQDARGTVKDDTYSANGKEEQLQCTWSTPATICQPNLFVKGNSSFGLIRK